MTEDEIFMRLALEEAKRAFDNGEVPVGCVIVREGEVIARAANERAAKKIRYTTRKCWRLTKRAKKSGTGGWRTAACT